jgi:histidinol-phosphate aminotransferase
VPKINPHILNVERHRAPYSPVDRVRLHASERDVPFSDELMSAFYSRLDTHTVSYYPNTDSGYSELSRFCGHNKKHLTLYEGSDRAIRDIFTVYGIPNSECIMMDPCFPMYSVYAVMHGLTVKSIPNTVAVWPKWLDGVSTSIKKGIDTVADWPKRPFDILINSINSNTSIVILSNPGTPYGELYSYSELIHLISVCEGFNCLLVIDEAYIEFAATSSLEWSAIASDSCIVIRTLSKGYGSAGIRIGYTISSELNRDLLSRVSSMNVISAPAVVWLSIVNDYRSEFDSYILSVITHRASIEHTCRLRGIPYIVGKTNFVHLGFSFSDRFITRPVLIDGVEYTRLSVPGCSNSMRMLLGELNALA